MSNEEPEETLPHLPAEIWSQVFSYSRLDDRKNIRLTCRRFYDICNNTALQTNEEFVFEGDFNSGPAIQSLSATDRTVWNVKLDGLQPRDNSILSFFDVQGARIRSLTLKNCTLPSGLLKAIIANCDALQSVALEFDSSVSPAWDRVFADFKDLEEQQIIRPDVTHFTLTHEGQKLRIARAPRVTNFVRNRRRNFRFMDFVREANADLGSLFLTNDKFLRFFAVFPNVRRLTVKVPVGPDFDQFSTISSEITSDTVFSYSCVHYQIVRMRHQLETLTLHFDYKPPRDYFPIRNVNRISQIEMENLKELSLSWVDLWDASVPNPFLQFRQLVELNCTVGNRIVHDLTKSAFVLLLLSAVNNLRSLTVTFLTSFCVDKKCFQALVRSRLRKLNISITQGNRFHSPEALSINFDHSSVEASVSPNYVLEHLDLGVNVPDSVLIMFTTYFRASKKLVVNDTQPSILETIFKYQGKLRYLQLHNDNIFPRPSTYLHNFSLFRCLMDITPSNQKFAYLTHLYLKEEQSLNLSEFLLSEFSFPSLKSLIIELHVRCLIGYNIDTLWEKIQNLDDLEYLEIQWPVAIPYEKLLDMCSNLFNLRYFIILDKHSTPFDNSAYRLLFQVNPSLRILVHKKNSSIVASTSVKYFNDVVTNTVINIPWPYQDKTTDFPYQGIPQKYILKNRSLKRQQGMTVDQRNSHRNLEFQMVAALGPYWL